VITLYSKADCHLCDIAKERIANVRRSESFELKTVDITEDPELFERYKERIPVVMLNGEEIFGYRVSEKQLRKKIRALFPKNSILARLRKRGAP
jgi:glutaredoxin